MRVAERLLIRLLGTAHTLTQTSIDNVASRVERTWLCGCASTLRVGDDVAAWDPCAEHAAYYSDAPTRRQPRRAFGFLRAVSTARVQVLSGTALAGAIAIVAKGMFNAHALRQRAEEAEGAALVDPLTGLYNRRGWDRRIEEERMRLKRERRLAIAIYMLDVDGLKQTNDERGHAAGDEALKAVAKIVKAATREHDVAARLGGDEFGILMLQSQAAEADLVRARLERGFHSAALSVSIGFAFAESADTIGKAMDAADLEMYDIKKKNRTPSVRHG
jgi:diguanylate cyclase (GGDEF)-like protein